MAYRCERTGLIHEIYDIPFTWTGCPFFLLLTGVRPYEDVIKIFTPSCFKEVIRVRYWIL